jgi:CP family cyanate transporter-like MFS transporter
MLSLSIVIGLLGVMFAAQWAVLWILFFGFGAGGGLILALAFISLRTTHAEDAAGLSGMAQCLGYSLAAAGPPLIGRLHDLGGNWSLPLGLCAVLGLTMACVGLLAGRNRQISLPEPA